MRFRVLGSMRVWDGAGWSPIRAPQQRVVLAVLLVEAGRWVTIDRLIAEIWSERPPSAALGTIHGYVYRLRRLLADGAQGRLATRGHGYQLDLEPDDFDAATFDRMLDGARLARAEGDLPAAASGLTEALALWRGAPYADVPPSPTVAAEVARLDEARLTAWEDLFGVQLELGRHDDVVAELGRLAREHPLRERLWGHLMLALYRCGRRAEALDTYLNLRATLVAELGIEPERPVRELHSAILAEDERVAAPPPRPAARVAAPVATTVPAQLPMDVAHFTGRAEHLARLDELRTPIAVLTGTAGVGKTALAVHWAHRARERFPDGQFHVNLRGYAAGPALSPLDVLARCLRGLGVPAPEIPADVDEAAALWRSLLAGRRVLVVLDNANRPDQVRPLVPGSPGCLVLVTSRVRLDGLVAVDGAVQLTLGMLPASEAHRLLESLGCAGRGAERLTELCGGLPLALRIAAANLQSRRDPDSFLAALANGARLDALQVADDPAATVRAAFDSSYGSLPPPVARVFRLLGLAPGPDVPGAAAAALAGTGVASELASLVGAHLVEDVAPDRYGLHDLLREYAAERASEDEPDRTGALDRLYAYYLHTAAAAADAWYPHVLRVPLTTTAKVRDAAAWLDAERANLVAIVTDAAVRGRPDIAWRLADVLRGYLYLRMHIVEWSVVAETAVRAATEDGDPYGRAAAHLGLGTLHWVQGRHWEAIEEFTLALLRSRDAGWVEGESAALGNLGNLHWALGNLDEAARHYRDAIGAHERAGLPASQATALGNLGLVHFGQGRLELAESSYEQALALHRRVGSTDGELRTLTYLGEVYRAQGRLAESLATLEDALRRIRTLGDRNSEGDALRALAATYRELGRHTSGVDLATQAVELARATGFRRLEAGALTTRATLHLAMGQVSLAIEGFQGALRGTRTSDNAYLETEALIGLAEARFRAGQPDAARAAAEEAAALAERNGYGLLARLADAGRAFGLPQ